MYKISEVSKLTGVSIRMLHHYDKIGLLIPSQKTEAKYRLYDNEDLKKLYEILILKELDFPLKEIKEILDSNSSNIEKNLLKQKELIKEKKKRLENILCSIDETLKDLKENKKMSKKNFKALSYEEIKKHEEMYKEESKKRYGSSNAYKEYEEKTSKYSKKQWEDIMAKGNLIFEELSSNMDKSPSSKTVQELVEKWRNHINTNFYNCTLEIFKGLAITYTSDPRFTKNINKYGEGLSEFFSEAINTYCDTHEK